ncbi:MAG: paraquat-inducible protein A [Cyclobacteriaceae bacterium]
MNLKVVIQIIFLISTLALAVNIFLVQNEKRTIQQDLIELSKVKYGLFNVDEWKTILAEIISKKIEELNFEDANQDHMRNEISKFLYKAIEEFEVNFRQTNHQKSMFGLSIKNMIAGTVSLFDRLKEEVPNITEEIITYFQDPKNRSRVKSYLIDKLDQYADKTFSELDYSERDRIYSKYQGESKTEITAEINNRLSDVGQNNFLRSALLFLLVVCQTIWFILNKNPNRVEFLLISLLSLIVLFLGLLFPMIDIDARISSMSFSLLGENVSFQNQVLYYKSKSILEVVYLMLSQGKANLFLVGLLVLMFSVLFPFSKLFASMALLHNENLINNRIIKFLIFKSGKWSMADVMVVSIFMAYLGFSGILTEQLTQLEDLTTSLDILTTNHSTLQLGFYMFTSFVLPSSFYPILGITLFS